MICPSTNFRMNRFNGLLVIQWNQKLNCFFQNKKGKTIPVIGRGGTYVCETWRPTRLTDGEVVSPTRWPPFTGRNILGTRFSWRLSPSLKSQSGWKYLVNWEIKGAHLESDLRPTFRLVATVSVTYTTACPPFRITALSFYVTQKKST
jgi:hypothetical protein